MTDTTLFYAIMSQEGLGPPPKLKKYGPILNKLITNAWRDHVKSWNIIAKNNFVKNLKAIDTQKIYVPGNFISKDAMPNKKLFYEKMWTDINKIIKMKDNKTLPKVEGQWFMYFFVKGFKNKDQANLYTQQNILSQFKKLGINRNKTQIGIEITWRKEGLKVKLRLETTLDINDDLMAKINQTYVNKSTGKQLSAEAL